MFHVEHSGVTLRAGLGGLTCARVWTCPKRYQPSALNLGP